MQLGTLDGSSSDVQSDGAKADLTPHWSYMAHKYDRARVRSLSVQQATRVVFGLVQEPEARFITSKRQPEIVGKELVYELIRGSTLRFVDQRAGYDLLNLRSYVDVDYIRLEPLAAPQHGER